MVNSDLRGNTLSFGSRGADLTPAGAIWIFTDCVTPQIVWRGPQHSVAWLWRSTTGPQLKHHATNTLGLFVPGATTSAITLNPAGTSIVTKGLTVGSGLTASGGLSNPDGIVNGGASGLTVNVGETNPNIALSPRVTGWTTLGAPLRVTNNTGSSNTATRALTLTGGVGAGDTLNAGNLATSARSMPEP